MSSKFIDLLKYLISFTFAFGLFAYLYQGDDLQALFSYMLEADMRWIALSIIAAIISHTSRALRWNIALQPLGYQPSLRSSFLAIMSGYFINTFVPRLGEVMRSGLLRKLEKVPVNTSFGAVLAERGIDLLILLSLTFMIFLIEFDKLGVFLTEQLTASSGLIANKVYVLAGLGLAGLLGILLLYTFRQKLLSLTIVQKLLAFVIGLKDGVLSIRQLSTQQQIGYALHTINIWLMYYFMSYLLFFSTPETAHLSPLCGLTTLIMGGIGMAIPSPGGIGTYHIFVTATFVAYGLSEELGKEFAFLMHSAQTMGVIIIGGLCFAIALVLKGKAAPTTLSES